MFSPRPSRPASQTRIATIVAVTILLVLSACASSDDNVTSLASQGDDTPVADSTDGQGGGAVATTAPVVEPVEPTTQSTVEPAAVEPTAVATPEVPTPAPTTLPPSPTEPAEVTPEPTVAQDAPIPVETPSLLGPQWFVQAVESAEGLPRPNGAVATIRFNLDGTVTGNAACNNFTASYTIDGGNLTVGNLAITEMNCVIPDWSAFVDLLPRTTGFGSAGGPDPILFAQGGSIALASTPPEQVTSPANPPTSSIGDYIGLAEIEAAQLADSRKVDFRVSSINGEPQALTLDFVEDRVNVDVVDGVVVDASLG